MGFNSAFKGFICGSEKRVEEKVEEEYEYCWAMTQAAGRSLCGPVYPECNYCVSRGECLYHFLGCDNVQSSVLQMEAISS